MMILIDVGNSRVKWATLEKESLHFGGAFLNQIDQFETALNEQISVPTTPSRILVSNVAGYEVRQPFIEWAKKQWQLIPEFITPTAKAHGVTIAYQDPEKMGADRWIALIAAWQRYQSALCVISCGSAITIDVLDREGIHQGGYIAPGLMLMRLALTEHTRAGQFNTLPPAVSPPLTLANSTELAINNGTAAMAAGFINQTIEQYMNEEYERDALSYPPPIILAGGDADIVNPYLHFFTQSHPYLVLEGLAYLAKNS